MDHVEGEAHDASEYEFIIDYLETGGDRAEAVKALKRMGLTQHDSIEFVLKHDGTVWDSRNGSYEYEYDELRRAVTTYH